MKEKFFNKYIVMGVVLLLIIAISLWIGSRKSGSQAPVSTTESPAPDLPSSKIEGELTFIKAQNPEQIKKIDIEVADNHEERNRGLMNRRSLPESLGMLFIFERAGPQHFWMKNTYIPLDIIFVNANKEIVKIHKYAAPHSIDSYPSQKDAQYVVEVIGGFTDKHNIQEGDRISFTLPNRPS